MEMEKRMLSAAKAEKYGEFVGLCSPKGYLDPFYITCTCESAIQTQNTHVIQWLQQKFPTFINYNSLFMIFLFHMRQGDGKECDWLFQQYPLLFSTTKNRAALVQTLGLSNSVDICAWCITTFAMTHEEAEHAFTIYKNATHISPALDMWWFLNWGYTRNPRQYHSLSRRMRSVYAKHSTFPHQLQLRMFYS